MGILVPNYNMTFVLHICLTDLFLWDIAKAEIYRNSKHFGKLLIEIKISLNGNGHFSTKL